MRMLLIIAVVSLCTACGVKVAPVASPTGTINPEDNSITEVRNDIAFTVKLDSLSVAPYKIADNIVSFHVDIENRSAAQAAFPTKSFVLKHADGHQYRAIAPEQVREILHREAVYLIPYPYVGYYYLQDQMQISHSNTFASSEPFFAAYNPQSILTRALPDGPIMKQSRISGLVYFLSDLERTNQAQLLVFPPAAPEQAPLATFTFRVEK